MHTADIPVGTGFYMMPHSLTTYEGVTTPLFRRVRDEALYVLTIEPADDTYAINNQDIAMMGVCDVKDALKDGYMAYYTMDAIPFRSCADEAMRTDEPYVILAVRVADLFYSKEQERTVIGSNKHLYYVDEHPRRDDNEELKGVKWSEVDWTVYEQGMQNLAKTIKTEGTSLPTSVAVYEMEQQIYE